MHTSSLVVICSQQEAQDEAVGSLAILQSLLGHQVGWRPQEEAGKEGGWEEANVWVRYKGWGGGKEERGEAPGHLVGSHLACWH